jgi:hypothetical protein
MELAHNRRDTRPGCEANTPFQGRTVTTDTGPDVDTVAGLIGASAPSAPIVYCETVLSNPSTR